MPPDLDQRCNFNPRLKEAEFGMRRKDEHFQPSTGIVAMSFRLRKIAIAMPITMRIVPIQTSEINGLVETSITRLTPNPRGNLSTRTEPIHV